MSEIKSKKRVEVKRKKKSEIRSTKKSEIKKLEKGGIKSQEKSGTNESEKERIKTVRKICKNVEKLRRQPREDILNAKWKEKKWKTCDEC